MNEDYDWTIEVGPGWKKIVERLVDLAKNEGATIGQVKEKFGGLRFYLDSPASPELYAAIEQAERDSYHTCEFCGAEGKPRHGGWIKTLCNQCDRKKNSRNMTDVEIERYDAVLGRREKK